MLKRKLKRMALIAGGILLASGLLAWWFISWINGNAEEYDRTHQQEEYNPAVEYAEANLVSSAVDETESGITDDYVQEQIHGMSHQKIRAMDKRYSIEMTQAKLAVLSEQVNQYKDSLHGYATYRAILDKWLAGDFSTADKDHNDIWEMQSGEIGKANGILSEAEERKFIEENF